jgi:hypothetical protein
MRMTLNEIAPVAQLSPTLRAIKGRKRDRSREAYDAKFF